MKKFIKTNTWQHATTAETGQECDSWSDVMDFMNYEGWKKRLVDGEWKHFCLECVECVEVKEP